MKREPKYIRSKDGARIYYEVHKFSNGKSCLIFIHGMGGSLKSWDKEVAFFKSQGISCIAVDLRGHGNSDRSEDGGFYSFDKFAEDILTIMEAESFKEYVIVGHCFGGMISITLEAKYPKRSKSLVLIDTSYKLPVFAKVFHANPFFRNIVHLIAKNVPDIKAKGYGDYKKFVGSWDYDPFRVMEDILHTSLRSYLLITESLLGYDATRLLKKILVPTLVIEGINDSVFPPSVSKELKNRIKRSTLNLIPGANHIIVLNNPDDLNANINQFLIKLNISG